MTEQLSLWLPAEDAPSSLAETDDRAREEATDPARSILLRAPAGSGKTTVLTQRLLRLLAEVGEPEEILAITFTRKAAAEMRERVLKALRGEIDATHSQARRLRMLAAAALARDAARGWGLVSNPGRLRVQTIDAFNYWLASQLPVAAKAGGALVVTDRPEVLYHRAARRVLSAGDADPALAADIELLFERIDNRWSHVERLVAEMLAKRGHWLPYVLGHTADALSARVAASVHDIVREQLSAWCGQVPKALKEVAATVPTVGTLGSGPEHLAAWQRLAALTLVNDGDWRKSVTRVVGVTFEQPDARQQLKDCIQLWSGASRTRECLINLALLPSPGLTAADAGAIQALSRVLCAAAMQLQLEFAAAGRVDYTYVAGAAREALTEEGLPTDLALRTGLALRHVLVDEFQDTSLAQFDLLEALTAGWEDGDGRTLFAVGDPMQSIYQFRDAEVGLFLRARDRGIGNVRLETLQLSRNFRSVAALVDWTSAAFEMLFPSSDDVRASAVAFTPSIAAREPHPEAAHPEAGQCEGAHPGAQTEGIRTERTQTERAVELNLFPSAQRAFEAQHIAERIIEIRRSDSEATIAVLVAARTHAPPIMAALAGAGVEAIGVDLVPLGEVSIVRDLVALTRALHHLGDRAAWLAVLRAPWCGVSLATLTQLSQPADRQLLWEAIADRDRLAQCADSDRTRLIRVHGVLNEALAARDRTPLADWLETTWLRLGGADACALEDLAHARAFFAALSDSAARGEWRGPHDIAGIVSDLYAEPHATAANPIQVMTIHRAKGLEFDHVFLPSLDRALNRDRDPLLRWLDLPRADEGSDLLMAPVPAIGPEDGGQLNAYLKHLISLRAANEQARLLYVAVTRARMSLHLSAAPKPRGDGTVVPYAGTLLARLWPALGKDFLAARPTPAGGEVADMAPLAVRRLVVDWKPPTLPEPPVWPRLPIDNRSLEVPEFSWVGETARHIGTVVHRALERFAAAKELPTHESIELRAADYLRQLRRYGVPVQDLERAARTVVDALRRTLADDRGRWLFANAHREPHSEFPLTGIAEGRLVSVVIDRTFVDSEGTRWVIDFKTSRHEGGNLDAFLAEELERYRPQLTRNAELARALGPQPVRAALYFPLLSAFREL